MFSLGAGAQNVTVIATGFARLDEMQYLLKCISLFLCSGKKSGIEFRHLTRNANERSVLTLGPVYLPCCVRTSVKPIFKIVLNLYNVI